MYGFFGHTVELIADDNLKEPTRLEAKILNDRFVFELHYRPEVENQIELLLPDYLFLTGLKTKGTMNSAFERNLLFEILVNIKNGYVGSEALLLKQKIAVFDEIKENLDSDLKILLDAKSEEYRTKARQLNEVSIQENKIKSKKLSERRAKTKALENFESQEKKLNDLILTNDRPAVRRMLEAYLPWEAMEPFETASWKTWLEAIERPNWKDVVVSYRGLDYWTDKVQRSKDGKMGLMSTVLTKNQGSYTRRLRSLTTNRLTNGVIKKFSGGQITAQMINHSFMPRASSYLSFTPDLKIANQFIGAKGGLVAVQIDSRRMISNASSIYSSSEKEFLAPLIVFPDEILYFQEGYPDLTRFEEIVRDLVENKLKLGSLSNLLRNSDYHSKSLEFYKKIMNQVESSRVSSSRSSIGLCRNLFGN